MRTNIDTNKPITDNVNCWITVLGNLLSLNNGGTPVPAFIMQVYLTAICSIYHTITDWKFAIHIKS